MIISGAHEPGDSVFLLLFEGRPPVSVIQEVQSIINDLGLNPRVQYPRAVIGRREAFSILARLLNVDEWTTNAEGTEVILKFESMRSFNARAVRDYLSMVTGWEWEIEGVNVTPGEERVIFAKFSCSGGCE